MKLTTANRLVSCALALALSLGLAGCGASPSASSAAAASDSSAAPAASEAADGYGTVVIRNGERTLTFTEMPQRVLCANLYSAENMVMLGLGGYIAGKNVAANDAEKPLAELADAFTDIPEIERSHENAVALDIDLIIGQVSAFKDSAWGSYESFESKGINCYTISGTIVPDETIENVYEDIENLGKIFKVEDRAAALIDDIKAQVAAVQEKVGDVPEDEKVTAFVMDSFNGNEIYTTSSGLQSNLIELAGGVNVTRGMADSRWFNTSVETIVAADPDFIIFNDYGSQTIEEKLAFINDNPALQDVAAVKEQNYIVIPLVAVMQDIRAASACETFAEAFYPERFAE